MSFDENCPKIGTTAQHGFACALAKEAGFACLRDAFCVFSRRKSEDVRTMVRLGIDVANENASAFIRFLKARADNYE